MTQQDFTTTFTVDRSPAEVFAAIANVRGWWSGNIDGETDHLGAEFTYRHRDLHRTTQKITEWSPGERIAWHVTDSYLGFVGDKDEWTGTDIVFTIAKRGDQTEVRFTHVGLAPAIECYDACSSAWGFYVGDSLRRLITMGRGAPNPENDR